MKSLGRRVKTVRVEEKKADKWGRRDVEDLSNQEVSLQLSGRKRKAPSIIQRGGSYEKGTEGKAGVQLQSEEVAGTGANKDNKKIARGNP